MTRTLLLLALLLTGCQLLAAGGNRYPPSTTIRLAASQPRTLDPALTLGDAGSAVGHIFSGLVTFDQQLNIEPELAAGWDVADDGSAITFFLRPDARFHDGRSLTAADVLFSWQRALHPDTSSDTAATYLGDIVGADALLQGTSDTLAGVEIIDDLTLRVTLQQPVPYFLAKLTYPVTFVVDRMQVDEPGWQYQANGTGPFQLVEWQDDQQIVLRRNEAYYKPQSNVEQILYRIGAGSPLTLYENGEIDTVNIAGDTLSRVADSNDPLQGNVQTLISLCTTFIGLNHRIPPFDDLQLRQAFNLALDKQRLADGLFQDTLLPPSGILPPGMPAFHGYDPYRFDPQQARDLLQSANFDRSRPLIFTTAGFSNAGGLPVAATTLWQETLGVDIDIELVDPFRFSDELYAGNVGNFYSYGWCADYPDPQNFLDILFHTDSAQNWGGYSNPQIDRLLEAARVEQQTATRMALYAEIEQLLLQDAPHVLVGHSLEWLLIDPRIENYELLPIGIPQWQRVNINPP